MKKSKIIIRTKSKTYPIYFGDGIIGSVGKLIDHNLPEVKKICILYDKNIPAKLIKKLNKSLIKYKTQVYKISVSERVKSLSFANRFIKNLLINNFNRSDCVIGFGGGILGDLSGFISSVTKRGIKFINIPTTLLAQVDASIGGKTAVNSELGKNLIGTFYQPDFVVTDVSVLKSLPPREIICGYGEILKHSLISNKKFFLWLKNNALKIINQTDPTCVKKAILESCKIKSKIVGLDEKEKNLRMILNFGHTFAHAFEATKKFSKKLNHGEAVLLGMIIACEFSYKKKLLDLKDLISIQEHYLYLNLPMDITNIFNKKEIDKIIFFIKKDKKNLNEKINLILLKKIGLTTKPNSVAVKSSELKEFLKSLYA